MNYSIINTIIQNIKTHCDAALPLTKLSAIIRAEQGGKEPAYPYGSYKLTSKDNYDYKNRIEKVNPDPTKYSEEYFRKEGFNISFVLIGKDLSILYSIADNIYNYLNILSKDFQRDNKIKIEVLNSISDRSILIDPEYEYRIGFDFKIHGTGILTNTIDAVDVTATINSIEYNYE